FYLANKKTNVDKEIKPMMNELNSLNPSQVCDALTTQNPKGGARRYLQKVLYFQKDFSEGNI
ncbi:MAG: hypothetical protein AAFX97_08975, partial [Pseudomonadota bacterium]